jgi:hypothetical protein
MTLVGVEVQLRFVTFGFLDDRVPREVVANCFVEVGKARRERRRKRRLADAPRLCDKHVTATTSG